MAKVALLSVAALLPFGPALAADIEQPPPVGAPVQNSWTFTVAPYGWIAGLSGDIGVGRVGPAAVDVDFGQILDHLDWFPPPVMLAGEARNGRYAVVTDFIYMGLGAEGSLRGPLHLSTDLDINLLLWTLGGSYRVVDNGNATLDLMVGGRLWYLNADLTVAGPVAAKEAGGNTTWVDPLIGVAGSVDLGSGFGLYAEADVGGFGAAADIDWQLQGTLQYKYNDKVTLEAGYRYLAVDYDDSEIVFDVALHGPIIRARFQF